jgi:ADP-ribosyl-[dinitrogen reductase] hydrolase
VASAPATLGALGDLVAGAHWALAGARGEYAAGAGAAMRVAPLAFVLNPAHEDDRVLARDVARITHHSDEAYAGALAVLAAIRHCASTGARPPNLLAVVADVLPDTRVRDRLMAIVAANEAPPEIASRFGASGYVVDAVPLALHIAVHDPSLPLDSLLARSVALGGDTDTIAAIAAQVAAAGGAALPEPLLRRITGIEDVELTVTRFAAIVGA